ncbi:hypothetical protein B0H14DRAFT_3856245 [Mycena olivaceomarginata]|nr:hypothetical protein B0H14DRAFT_3856245 [Mycena olivaceomarginata]
MLIAQEDNKGVQEPSAQAEVNGEPSRARSPPPAYSSSTDAGPIPTIVPQPELPSAFRPPSPSSFPHPNPTRISSSGPTPLFMPVALTPSSAEAHYPYYDPRSPYSLALADKRAWDRFWSAFMCSIVILVLLWFLGLIQFGS